MNWYDDIIEKIKSTKEKIIILLDEDDILTPDLVNNLFPNIGLDYFFYSNEVEFDEITITEPEKIRVVVVQRKNKS